ncbi:MAG: hemerythrin family protein [Treponema sp.]|nr:hemerythrin family protein [Treponema sp.]
MEAFSLDDLIVNDAEQSSTNSEWVKWTPNLELGIPVIDRQHKHLVSLCNELHESLVKSRSGSGGNAWRIAIANAMRQTVEYARTHFADEEKLMRASNFDGYAAHRQHHCEFIQTLTKVLINFDDMSLPLAFDFADYLRDWILSHVACVDKLYCPVIKSFYRNLKLQQQQAENKTE